MVFILEVFVDVMERLEVFLCDFGVVSIFFVIVFVILYCWSWLKCVFFYYGSFLRLGILIIYFVIVFLVFGIVIDIYEVFIKIFFK